MTEQMKLTPETNPYNFETSPALNNAFNAGAKAQLDKCLSLLHGEELRERIAERIFLCYQEDTRKTLEMDAKLTDEKIEYRVRSWDSLAYADKAFHYECADEVISLFPLKEEEKKDV